MKKIVLHETHIKNLNTFLDRVPLTGRTEAIAMVELIQIINAAQEIKPETEK